MNGNHRAITRVLGPVAGVTLGLIYWRYRRDTQATAARLQAGSQVIETSYGPVEYASVGNGSPVLVVHGGGGGYDQGLLLARFLDLSDRFHCTVISRFGYLRSPVLGDASPVAQADAYAALLDALNLPHVVLVGGSAGGPSCLQFALCYPDRCTALVLISALSRAWAWPTLPPVAQNVMPHSGLAFWALVNFAPLALLAAFGISRQSLAQAGLEEKARLMEILQTLLPTYLRCRGLVNDASQLARIGRYPLERIAAPTLVIHAVDDVLAPFAHGQFSAQTIPGARLLTLNSGGHLWLGQREKLVAAITEFLPA